MKNYTTPVVELELFTAESIMDVLTASQLTAGFEGDGESQDFESAGWN